MLLRILDRFEEVFISLLMAAAVILIFVAVAHRFSLGWLADFMRYARAHDMAGASDWARSAYKTLAGIRLTWAQEACIYLFVWMAKFGAAYGVRTGIHVGVDVAINRMNPALRGKFIIFGMAAGALSETWLVRRRARAALPPGNPPRPQARR